MRRLGFFGVSGQSKSGQKPNLWGTPAASTSATNPVASGPSYEDVSGLYREALASLTGDVEKTYQSGKRRTLSDIAIQSINAGAANTLNLPAAGIAYDEANRPATNLALGQAKAGVLTGLGQTAAGLYGQNLGAQTSLQTAQLGAQTSQYGAQLGFQTNAAQRALDKYLGELENTTANRKLSLQAQTGAL